MDLLSSIRKEGSRGGVNFSWEDVQTSQHRENYLGHSLNAPVGRWQKGRDLNWYAKGDKTNTVAGETAEQTKARERKEEIRLIKEAEEDAFARAMGLPVAERGVTGANAITVGEVNRMVKEVGVGEEDDEKIRPFGDFVGKVAEGGDIKTEVVAEKGGLLGEPRSGRADEKKSRKHGRERGHRDERDRRARKGRSRSPGPQSTKYRERSREHHRRRRRSESRDNRRHRSVSRDHRREILPNREGHRNRERSREGRRYRSRSRENRRHNAGPESSDDRRQRPGNMDDRRERSYRSRSRDRWPEQVGRRVS